MADISKLSVGGTTYDIKDAVARASAGGSKIYTNLGIIAYGSAVDSSNLNCTKILYNGKEYTDAAELKAAIKNDTRVTTANRIYRFVINGDISSFTNSSTFTVYIKLNNTQVISLSGFKVKYGITKYIKFGSQSSTTSTAYFSAYDETSQALSTNLVESDLYSLYRSIEGGTIIPNIVYARYTADSLYPTDHKVTNITIDTKNVLYKGDIVYIASYNDGRNFANSSYYDVDNGNVKIYSTNGRVYKSIPTCKPLLCVSMGSGTDLIALNADQTYYADDPWGSSVGMWTFADIQTFIKSLFAPLLITATATSTITLYNNGTSVTISNSIIMRFSNGKIIAVLEGSFNPNTASFTLSDTANRFKFNPEIVLNGTTGYAYPVYYDPTDSKYKLVTSNSSSNSLFVLIGSYII